MKAKQIFLRVAQTVAKVNRPFWTAAIIANNIGCLYTWTQTGCSSLSLFVGCAWFTVAPMLLSWYIQAQSEEIMHDLKKEIEEGK